MKAEKAVKGAKRRELEKTVRFWENVFLNKKFTDKKMHPEDKGLWGGRKYIDSVFKNDQIYVGYSPDIRQAARSGGDSAKQDQVDNASGFLTVNETLDQFPSLKRKYKASYDYYVKKNKYEEGADYTEAFS